MTSPSATSPGEVSGFGVEAAPLAETGEPRYFCPRRGLNAGATAQLARETASLLQRRLATLAWVGALGFALALARFWLMNPSGVPGAAAGLGGTLLCLVVLKGRTLEPRALRLMEATLFGVIVASMALTQYLVLGGALEEGRLGLYRQLVNRMPGLWVLIVMAYGMLVPNRWRRPAAFGAAAALTAIGTGVTVYLQYRSMVDRLLTSEVVETAAFGLAQLALGVLLASAGANLIHGYRADLAEADNAGMYLLQERLGFGGMGEIWQAQHRMLRRPVAIKMIRRDLVGGSRVDPDTLQRRFRREARATARLQSPYTVHVFDFGVTQDGTLFYVMEFLDGLDLVEIVKHYGPMPANRAVYLIRQAALSLREAHERGLVHRDVKPSNIHVGQLAGSWDWVKVLDFGLVKLTENTDPEDTELTEDRTTTGTPAFFPPEMAAGASAADHRADIYALGAVTYWLVTGQLVFPDLPPLQMMLAHAKEDPVPPSQRVEMEIPADLEAVILKMLRKEPADRPQSMDEVVAALDACDLGEPWTSVRAADWWQLHHPENVARAVAHGPDSRPGAGAQVSAG